MNKILHGDCMDVLKTLPDGIVQTCITSPPYWGLRDYGTATWEGGDPDCEHGARVMGNANKGAVREVLDGDTSRCYHCGAVRIDKQLGLEKTPEEYVEKMVAVFREVRRVLKDDGTVWLNLGDTYSNNRGSGSSVKMGDKQKSNPGSHLGKKSCPIGLKEKDLVGIPWRVAFALQADGWYLRQDIIWSKPNPMPESVTDRCTKAHEYLFLLSKNAKYFYDANAIKEPFSPFSTPSKRDGNKGEIATNGTLRHDSGRLGNGSLGMNNAARNKRSVWHIATQPFPDAHFAVMPERLVEPCVLAGSRGGDIVLDPFMGAGTVAKVAMDCQRRFIGIELSGDYIKIAEKRIAQKALDLTK